MKLPTIPPGLAGKIVKYRLLCKIEGIKLINGQTIKEVDEIMTMNKELHPRSDVARIYVPSRKGGRGLISCEGCVRRDENNLSWYVRNSEEVLLRKVGDSNVVNISESVEPK